jgi:hypothetical protein
MTRPWHNCGFLRPPQQGAEDSIVTNDLEYMRRVLLSRCQMLVIPSENELLEHEWRKYTKVDQLRRMADDFKAIFKLNLVPDDLVKMHISTLRLIEAWIGVLEAVHESVRLERANRYLRG